MEISDPEQQEETKENRAPCCHQDSLVKTFRINVNDCFEAFHSSLKQLFFNMGFLVGSYPSYFTIVPFLVSVIAITGLQRLAIVDNTEQLFYPEGGTSGKARDLLKEVFPLNFSSGFDPSRYYENLGIGRVYVRSKDGGTVFRKIIWDEILTLDNLIRSLEIEHHGRTFNYSDLCAGREGVCYRNDFLDLNRYMEDVENGTFLIPYPLVLTPFVPPHSFGGATVNYDESAFVAAKSVALNYFINRQTKFDSDKALKWEHRLEDLLLEINLDRLEVAFFTGQSLEEEVKRNFDLALHLSFPSGIFVVLFCFLTGFQSDWVRGKPLLQVVGAATASIAGAAAFGFLLYLGIPCSRINLVAFLLNVGIGLDDMFVLLAAWSRTRIQDPVPQRLAETFSEAGISISFTSATNVLSFLLGVATPVLSVRSFCLYAGMSILFSYILFITFFSAFLAWSGTCERNQRHCLLFITVKSKSEAVKEESSWYYAFLAGGINKKDPWNSLDNGLNPCMVFLRDHLGRFINSALGKSAVLVVYILYIGGAIFGCLRVDEGLKNANLVVDDSYLVDFFREDQLYKEYSYRVQCLVAGNVSYSDPTVKRSIMDLHSNFEGLPIVGSPLFTHSTIRNFYKYLERDLHFLNITDERNFIELLKTKFLDGKTDYRPLDVTFSEDGSRIKATRMVFQVVNVSGSLEEVASMNAINNVAQQSHLNVTCFSPYFMYFDQFVLAKPLTIQVICTASLLMLVASIFFLRNRWCSVWVVFSILSIEMGLIGYMSLWSVSLDQISMMCLIMSIGFCVDFTAHISYSYLSYSKFSPQEKVNECILMLGLPIIQGGTSTVLAVIVFAFAPSYSLRVFFKLVLLVVLFATVHGLLVVPIILSAYDSVTMKFSKDKNQNRTFQEDKVKAAVNGNKFSPDFALVSPNKTSSCLEEPKVLSNGIMGTDVVSNSCRHGCSTNSCYSDS